MYFLKNENQHIWNREAKHTYVIKSICPAFASSFAMSACAEVHVVHMYCRHLITFVYASTTNSSRDFITYRDSDAHPASS